MTDQADNVRRKLLGLEVCPRCKSEAPKGTVSMPFLPGCLDIETCRPCKDELLVDYSDFVERHPNEYLRPIFKPTPYIPERRNG